MSEPKPYRLEVTIDAPRDVVWRALTDPAEIRRWFGWDYATLDDEIRFIFVDHATPRPPDGIDFGAQQLLSLEERDGRTVVRLVVAGAAEGAEWSDVYDEIEEGWRAFFNQLRHYLERHRGEDRRTVFLAGRAPARDVVRALDAMVSGTPWLASRHQRMTATEAYGGGLVGLLAVNGTDASDPGRVTVTLTTHGLDDARFAEVHRQWGDWWRATAEGAKVTP